MRDGEAIIMSASSSSSSMMLPSSSMSLSLPPVMMLRIVDGSVAASSDSSTDAGPPAKTPASLSSLPAEPLLADCCIRTNSEMTTMARCIAIFMADCRISRSDAGNCSSTASRSSREIVPTSTYVSADALRRSRSARDETIMSSPQWSP